MEVGASVPSSMSETFDTSFFSYITLSVESGHLIRVERVEIQVPYSVSGAEGQRQPHFFFSSWCLARIEWLFLKRFSTFLDCSSPDHLTERETFLLGIFYFLVYVCAHWHFQVASFSSVQSGVYEGKRKPRNASPCRSLGPDVPRQIPFFLPFRVYLCLLYIECPGFLVALSGRNMEKYFYSIQKELFLQIRHV